MPTAAVVLIGAVVFKLLGWDNARAVGRSLQGVAPAAAFYAVVYLIGALGCGIG